MIPVKGFSKKIANYLLSQAWKPKGEKKLSKKRPKRKLMLSGADRQTLHQGKKLAFPSLPKKQKELTEKVEKKN